MKRVFVEVMNSGQALKRFAEIWKKGLKGKDVEPTLSVGSVEMLNALLSPKRMELLRYVAQHPQRSVRSLAKALGRDYKNVHTDVAELEDMGLLARGKDARITAPYDEIIIRAPLRKAA